MNVIGNSDISRSDWIFMKEVLSSISYYKENNQTGKYDRALEREVPMYRKELYSYLGRQ